MHERWGFIYPPPRCHSRAMETVWNTSKLKPCCYRPRALWRADHRLRLTSAPCARVLERCTANSKCAFDNNREAEQSVLQGSYARRPWPRGGCVDASPRDHKLLLYLSVWFIVIVSLLGLVPWQKNIEPSILREAMTSKLSVEYVHCVQLYRSSK